MARKQSAEQGCEDSISDRFNRRRYVKLGGLAAVTAGISTVPGLADSDEWSYDSASGVHTDLPYELVIDHVEPGARVEYEVEFDGEVETGEWEYNAFVEGNLAWGGLGPERGLDNIYFDGTIERFDVKNADHARYYIADAQAREIIEAVHPDDFPREEQSSGSDDSAGEYQEFVVGQTPAGELAYDGAASYVADGYLRIFIEDGSTLEHVLFDFTEHQDAGILIVTSDGQAVGPFEGATDWTIRNVGFRGMPNRDHSIYPIYAAVSESDGIGRIENVFMDLRGEEPGGSGFQGSAVNVFPQNRGTVINRHNFVAGPGGNCSYMEGDRAEGRIIWEHCYYRDASSTLYRTGLGGSEVRNCVAVRNDPEGYRGPYFGGPTTSLGIGRAFWNRGGKDGGADPVIDNLHMYYNPDENPIDDPVHTNTHMGSPSRTIVEDATINEGWVDAAGGDAKEALCYDSGGETVVHGVTVGSPDITVLGEGVPYSPEMAAAGQRGYPPNPFGPSPDGGIAGETQEQPDEGSDDDSKADTDCQLDI